MNLYHMGVQNVPEIPHLKELFHSNGNEGLQNRYIMTCSMSLRRQHVRCNLWTKKSSPALFLGQEICSLFKDLDSAKVDHKFSQFIVAASDSFQNKEITTERGLSNVGTLRTDSHERTEQQQTRKYHFHVSNGGQVRVLVNKMDLFYKVIIEACLEDNGEEALFMDWGVFRSDSSDVAVLDLESIPAKTAILDESMQTPFERQECAVHKLELEFRSNLAPFFISFMLSQPSNPRNLANSKFCIPVGFERGQPDPLGMTVQSDGRANFALYSKNAQGVILCLYDAEGTEPCMQLELSTSINRTGHIWHVELDNVSMFTRYGYRCKGETTWERGNRFHSRRILLDPYAKSLAPFVSGQDSFPSPAPMLALVTKAEAEFDWDNDVHLDIPLERIVAYRLNVTCFTADKSCGLEKNLRGTFQGLVEKIQHFKNLGVNAVILQPVFAFEKNKGPFFPLSLFSPMDCFGPLQTPMSSSLSLKEMVKELHKNGIEVLLEVVYTHTGENNDEEPQTVSFRGIDNATYYVLNQNSKVAGEFESSNFFNCNHPVVQKLILDSLQYWVTEYHIDGFCFANASALTRGPHREALTRPLVVEAISFDPVLSRRKIIADFFCPFTGSCKDTAFPHWRRWCLWNSRYRDDVRQFMRGDKGQLSSFATRLCGSGDILADGRGPNFSLNFVSNTYGLTLVDLVSYSEHVKEDLERSWNCGEEGPTLNQAVLNLRVKQVRNFVMCLFLSQGIPVLNMGDEYGHTKGGGIAMDQRRAFNWDALNLDFAHQLRHMISSLAAFRVRRKDLFQCKDFIRLENVKWHGKLPNEPEWENADSSFLAVSLHPEIPSQPTFGDIYIGFNSQNSHVVATLPDPPAEMSWYRIADTSLPYPDNFLLDGLLINVLKGESRTYKVEAHSSVLLEARAMG